MVNKSSFLLALLLLITFAMGMETRLVEEMNLTVVQQGYVRAIGGELKYLNMNISIPSETDYQMVVSDKPVSKLDEENSIVNIESKNPTNPFNYKITSSVAIKARKTIYLPESYQLSYAQMRYTQPTERVQSNDERIRELARGITENSSDDFERVAKLALWVNKQLTYDLSLAGMLKDARWILENKKGVCTEYSTLFIALARSIGIPARFVSGLAYDEDKKEWIGHSWAEVYIGKWVPVDPTWSPPEIGYLDAAHLDIAKMLDNETFDNVYALTSQNARLDWSKPDDSKGAEIKMRGVKEVERNANYQLEGVAGRIGFGVRTVVFASLLSDDYRVASLNLTPCTGDVISVEGGEKQVILRPGERVIVSWVVSSNSTLSSSYWYTCPLLINSDYFKAKEVEIEVIPDMQSINFNAYVEKSEVRLGENQTVYVDVGVARSYEGRLYTTHDDYFYFQPITRSGRYSFSLQPKRIGLNKLYVATSLGGVKELQFKVTGPQGIGVEVSTLQLIPIGVETKVYVNLTSNESDRSIRITASAGENRQAKQTTLTGNSSVEFSFNFTDPSVQNITVIVESSGFLRELVKPIALYTIPQVNLTHIFFKLENGSVRTDLIFSGVRDATDVFISIDDRPISLMQNGSASALLTPGTHVLKVNYSDAAGMKHGYAQILELPLISTIEKNQSGLERYIKEIAVVLPPVCLGLILILLLAVLVLKKFRKKPQ